MKKKNNLIIMLLVGALAAMSPHWAAASTAPCTDVENIATLAYKVGGVDQANETGTTNFDVGVKVIVTVANGDGGNITVVPGTTKVALKFTVTNSGNAVQDYDLAALAEGSNNDSVASPHGGGNDTFDGTTIVIYDDTGGSSVGSFDVSEDSVITSLDNVAADGGSKVVYIVYTPSDLAESDGAIAIYYLEATSKWINDSVITAGNVSITAAQAGGACGAGTTVDVVYGDADGPGPNDTASPDGIHSDDSAYIVSSANISVSKTATTIWDPINHDSTPKAIPGALVRYDIAISNGSGAASATLTTITDTLVASLAMDADLLVASDNVFASLSEESGAGKGFKAKVTGSTRVGSGTGMINNTDTYYTTTDGDADGIKITGQAITTTLATLLDADTGGGTPYTAGELKADETLTITFNVIIQ